MGPITPPLLTPEGLDAWLAGHAPDRTVGTRMAIRTCPLACYLSKRTGHTWLVMGGWAEPTNGPDAGVHTWLPRWAEDFTGAVDGHATQNVTAEEARTYLQGVLRLNRHTMGDAP